MSKRLGSVKRLMRAFTLVETLVVIAVLAVLVTLLFPAVIRARAAAHSAKCTSSMRQIAAGVQTFAYSHDGRGPGAGRNANGSFAWQNKLNAEVFGDSLMVHKQYDGKNRAKLYCPAAATGEWSSSSNRSLVMNSALAGNQFTRDGYVYYQSGAVPVPDHGKYLTAYKNVYGASWTFVDKTETSGQISYGYYLGQKISVFRNPSTKFMIIETETGRDSWGGAPAITWSQPPSPAWSAEAVGTTSGQAAYSFRHPTARMNVAFMDGHVESVPFSMRAMDDKYFNPTP